MANLIPPDAKKSILIEYWVRVVVVWCTLIGLGLILVAILKLPTFILLQAQLNAFSGKYDDAKSREDSFADAQQIIIAANELSGLLSEYATTTPSSQLIEILDEIAGPLVAIQNFTFARDETMVTDIQITGVAKTRTALANFSNDIEAHELFAEAEVPISNLAKDKDIIFNINIVPQQK